MTAQRRAAAGMTAAREESRLTGWRRPALVFALGLLLCLLLAVIHVGQGQAQIGPATIVQALLAPDAGDVLHNIVRHVRLPRVVVGLLAGAALGLSGALLQTAMNNPLVSPATVGVNAGAYLALVASTLYTPPLFDPSPLTTAFFGGLGAALLVYVLAGRRRATPVGLVLAGMAVSMALASFTAALQLLFENETSGLFLWGAGFLLQQDWSEAHYALPRLLPAALAALLLARELDVLSLGDATASSLGQRVAAVRLGAVALAVFLAAIAVSTVGPIGFVGLTVPHIVRLMGLRRHHLLLPGAVLWGGVLLLAADVVGRWINPGMSELPAGVVTAIVGAPVLVWLVRRARPEEGVRGHTSAGRRQLGKRLPYRLLLAGGLLLLFLIFTTGLLLGTVTIPLEEVAAVLRGEGTALGERVFLRLRLPRLLVALFAGASLAVSGMVLQGIVRNPLAAPSVVGVTAGAGLGALAVLIALPQLPVGLVPVAAFGGALLALGVTVAAAWRNGLSPARLALIGIGVSAFCSALINWLVVQADVRVAVALAWLAGSTYARGWSEVAQLLAWPLLLIPLIWFLAPRLDVIGLGDDVARGLGLRLEQTRLLLLVAAVALAGAAVATVGTVSFVGLMAPHAARMLVGARHRQLLPLTAVLGAMLVVASDVVGRLVLSPAEIPVGLVTAVVGAPYLLWLLRRQ
ncbi:MAG: iron ABC transporter permease [Candidatus Promineifilaceae bacterium]|nr:iron ABC transporter permease [Candidatus Promineifilaceae bacterium]